MHGWNDRQTNIEIDKCIENENREMKSNTQMYILVEGGDEEGI